MRRLATRRSRAHHFCGAEPLEKRMLLANITASAVISSTPAGSNFNYNIVLSNSSSSNSGIGTFWYAWIPGEDFLATSPISVTPPTGWGDSITNMGSGDGYAILYTANSSASYVAPGSTLSFQFQSADTPAQVNGNSIYYPNTPVGTSYVYPQGPFSDGGHVFVVAPALDSIAVTPANPSVAAGQTQQFTATGTYDGGSTQNITSQVTWSSSSTAVATISNASGTQGLATAVAAGSTTISAALSGVTGSTGLTVTAPVLESIAVTPANPSVPAGKTEQFTATGTYSDNSTQDLTSQVTWASATASVATISNASGSQGLATAVATGSSSISAALNGVTGSTVLTVTAAVLASIAVTPANPTISSGATQQFTATGTYSDNSTQDITNQVTWASATPAVATITSAGLATGVSTGGSSISATLDGITGSTVLTVAAAVLESIAVTPANPSVAAGGTEQFTATGTYSDNSTQDLTTQVTWASATPGVATISNASGSQGLATAVATGSSSISATLNGVTGTTVLTVTAAVLESIAVTPANPTVALGSTEQFTATGTYSDNSTQDITNQVTWASATPAVATISSGGLATGVSTGSSSISATLDGVNGSTVLTVAAAVLESIAVTPANPSVPAGETEQFTATGTFSDNSTQDLTSQVTWASATPSVATISNAAGTQGLATGVAAGSSSISATLDGITGSTVLTVSAAVLKSIAVTPANPSIVVGATEQFTATGTFSDNTTQDLTSQVTWASATPGVATINSAGLATGVAAGSSTISAALDSITGSTVLNVTASVLESIAISPANPSISVGQTEAFTATGTYSNNSTQDLTDQVTWASGSTSVATISNASGTQGLAKALAAGGSTITASLNGITGSTLLKVTAPMLESITVTPSRPDIPLGTSLQLTAMGTYSDQSTQNLTNQVVWSSSQPTFVTISGDGTAAGIGVGSATITATLGRTTGATVVTISGTAASTATTISSSTNPAVYGQSVTFTATVSALVPGTGTPGGTVTFYRGSKPMGTGTLNSAGVAQFTTVMQAVGTLSISAVYGGDSTFDASTSSALSESVQQDGTTSVITSSANPSAAGSPLTFTVTVAAILPGSGFPTGVILFESGSTVIGQASLSGGTASYTTSSLAAGSYVITGVYAGDSHFTGSSSRLKQVITTQSGGASSWRLHAASVDLLLEHSGEDASVRNVVESIALERLSLRRRRAAGDADARRHS
jgi:uncharacterized protein YjdB